MDAFTFNSTHVSLFHEFIHCLSLHHVPTSLEEGLNGVNRQPSNGLEINRQLSKTKYFYRQPSNERAKINRQIS